MEKKNYTIDIEFEAGSEFQKELFEKQLMILMNALIMSSRKRHKGNKIDIEFSGARIIKYVDGFYMF